MSYVVMRCSECGGWFYAEASQKTASCRNYVRRRTYSGLCGKRYFLKNRKHYYRTESPQTATAIIQQLKGAGGPLDNFVSASVKQ